jgi:hypothetical protein
MGQPCSSMVVYPCGKQTKIDYRTDYAVFRHRHVAADSGSDSVGTEGRIQRAGGPLASDASITLT